MSVEVRTPRGTATIAGGSDFVVGGVTLSSSIGRPSTATLSIHTKQAASSGAVEVTSSQMIQQLSSWQSKMFQIRLTPDCDITLQDGNNGTLNFKGFISNPQYTLSRGGVSFQNGVNHQASIIGAYKSFIYDFSVLQDAALDEYRGKFSKGIKGDSCAELILSTLTSLVRDSSVGAKGMGINPSDKFTHDRKSAQHSINKQIFPFVEKLLQDSFATTQLTPAQQKMMSKTSDHRAHLLDCIIARLLQENDDFWQTLNSLAAAFQLVYIPSMAGDMGKFIRYSALIDGFTPQLTAVLPVTSMSISCGSIYGLPTSQCLVRATPNNSFRGGGNNKSNVPGAIVAAFPKAYAYLGGNVIMANAPPWLPILSVSYKSQQKADQEASNGAKGRGLSLDRYAFDKIAVSEFVAETEPITEAILSDWARNAYLGAALQATQLSASIPMDLTLVPGFYDITAKDGTKIGKGVLNQVTHTLNCENPQNAQASTQVSFAHIQTEGFQLPQ